MRHPSEILLSLAALAAPAPSGPTPLDFATLSDFQYVEGMELPAHVTVLDGDRVKIAGFMRREDGGQGATDEFMLINDACGCNGTPFLNEIVFCSMPSGKTTKIKPGIVEVTGTLSVGETRESGIVVSIYTLEVETVGS